MIYIGHNNGIPFFLEIEEELNTEDNVIVYTWEDFIKNEVAWLKLSAEQESFYNDHPDATPEEVYNMQLTPEPEVPDPTPAPEPDPLFSARQAKLEEIRIQDKFSEKFFVSVTSGGVEVANYEMPWIERGLRSSLLNTTLPSLLSDGITVKKFWTNTVPSKCIEAPISWVKDNLSLLELYATRTWDCMKANEAAVYAATTVEEIEAINVKANYPLFLTFELNLDKYEQA